MKRNSLLKNVLQIKRLSQSLHLAVSQPPVISLGRYHNDNELLGGGSRY